MSFPLLPTKLHCPPSRAELVPRPRLIQKLFDGLKAGVRLSLVCAPAGFGKSTLVYEWARQTALPVAWLACDEGDNDPIRFWNYFLAAIQTVEPGLGSGLTEQLNTNQPAPLDVLVTLLVNELASHAREFCIVLDDYHLIENENIHKNLDFLLDHMPPVIHIAIVTRTDPPLHLGRRRGRAEVCEVRGLDLRFNPAEAADFLNQVMKLGLEQRDIDALASRTEGWIVGLQLAALSLQGRDDPHAFISSFEGDDRYIADYLVEEVLNRQPESIRDFLLDTSILSRMNGELCDALTGGQDGKAILIALENANLFTIPLDNRREWFRYHQLFARLLQKHLVQKRGPASLASLYSHAMDWHIQHGFIREAVEYALKGREFEAAVEMINQVMEEMFYRNEFVTLLQWTNAIPESLLAQKPALGISFGWAAIATSNHKRAEQFIRMVENNLGITVDQFLAMGEAGREALPASALGALVELTVQRARVAIDRDEAGAILDIYSRILPYLTEERSGEPYINNPPYYLRGPMLVIIALANRLQGNTRQAVSEYSEAIRLGVELHNPFIFARGSGHLGQLLVLQGHLRIAEATFKQAIEYSMDLSGQVSGIFGHSLIGMGALAYERNDLNGARHYLEDGVRLAQILNDWEGLLDGLAGIAKLRMAEGNPQTAFEAANALGNLSHNHPKIILAVAEGVRAQLMIQQNRLGETESWARTQGYTPESEPAELPGEHARALARLWYASGQLEPAHQILLDLQKRAEKEEEWGRWIEVLALEALVEEARGRHEPALGLLKRALQKAEGEFYIRTFVDFGKPMRDLLQQARKSKDFLTEHAAVDLLLRAFDFPEILEREEPRTPVTDPRSVEPLSNRELDVLRLMATGASNQDIAHEIVVTVNTVKKHISHIFGKLGVTTRVQAIEQGRKSGLIPK